MSVGNPRLFPAEQDTATGDDAYTPPWVFDRMGIEFDLDVCSPPGGIPWVPAVRYYTQADDGLLQPWQGRVWMNPPWKAPKPWVARFITHADGVALVPCSSGRWFHDLWVASDAVVVPTPGTMTFHRPDLTPYPGGLPIRVAMFAFGGECAEAIGRLGVGRVAA